MGLAVLGHIKMSEGLFIPIELLSEDFGKIRFPHAGRSCEAKYSHRFIALLHDESAADLSRDFIGDEILSDDVFLQKSGELARIDDLAFFSPIFKRLQQAFFICDLIENVHNVFMI